MVESSTATQRTWGGFWSGLLWVVVGYAVVTLGQLAVIVVLIARDQSDRGRNDVIRSYAADGDVVSISYPFFLPILLAIFAFAIKVRLKEPLLHYLGFKPVTGAELRPWLFWFVVLIVAGGFFGWLFDRPVTPDWMIRTYATVDYLPIFWICVMFLAPLTEELLVRGYLLKRWAESKLGPAAAIVFTAALWASVHLQYDAYDMFVVFIFGVLLAVSRLASGSIYPALLMHALWNTLALIVVQWYASGSAST